MAMDAENEELEQLNIMAVHEDGLHLQLSDGSTWDIAPGPSAKVLLWCPPQRVTVEEAEETGDYIITNLDTGGPDRIHARIGHWDPDDDQTTV
jgi:hypothetical protein